MKKWTVAQLNKDRAVAISTKHELPMLISMLLDIRGITDDEKIQDFLYNDYELTYRFVRYSSNNFSLHFIRACVIMFMNKMP